MHTAAIISEYNPFHKGHEYQIKKIKDTLGEDTALIAVMSGNLTQRGEMAVTDKLIRAEAAVECGVNLVLELPFPFSMSSAEIYAKSGVRIVNAIGVVDKLVFGSESGDIDTLTRIAVRMSSPEFLSELSLAARSANEKQTGYPTLCERVYKRLYGDDAEAVDFLPNNILAIEYIKALMLENSSVVPMTFKREGAGYNDGFSSKTEFQSASAIRELLTKDVETALEYIPNSAKKVFLRAIAEGIMPSDSTALDAAVISHFRLNPPTEECNVHDAVGGLYNRLYAMSIEATSISSLISLTETKKFTRARISRATWNSYFGVTSSEVKSLPAYTQVLAMDDIGQTVLKRIKKMSDFPIITKPSAYRGYGDEVVRQKELSNKLDAVFELTLKRPRDARQPLKFTPFVKK